jgi:hypothetical protein
MNNSTLDPFVSLALYVDIPQIPNIKYSRRNIYNTIIVIANVYRLLSLLLFFIYSLKLHSTMSDSNSQLKLN